MYETVFENECTTIEEEKCEIQYMTQYEEECSTINEQVKMFILILDYKYCNLIAIILLFLKFLQYYYNLTKILF